MLHASLLSRWIAGTLELLPCTAFAYVVGWALVLRACLGVEAIGSDVHIAFRRSG